MTVLIAAASVFIIIKGLRYFLTAPGWFFFLLMVTLSTVGAWLVVDQTLWALGVAGVTHLFFRFDTLLRNLGDQAMVSVLKNSRR